MTGLRPVPWEETQRKRSLREWTCAQGSWGVRATDWAPQSRGLMRVAKPHRQIGRPLLLTSACGKPGFRSRVVTSTALPQGRVDRGLPCWLPGFHHQVSAAQSDAGENPNFAYEHRCTGFRSHDQGGDSTGWCRRDLIPGQSLKVMQGRRWSDSGHTSKQTSPLLPAPPPQLSHQETRRVQWTPPVLQNGSTARQGWQGPGEAPGWKAQGDGHLRLWPNRALEATRASPGSSLESARASVCCLPAESPQRPASACTPCLWGDGRGKHSYRDQGQLSPNTEGFWASSLGQTLTLRGRWWPLSGREVLPHPDQTGSCQYTVRTHMTCIHVKSSSPSKGVCSHMRTPPQYQNR